MSGRVTRQCTNPPCKEQVDLSHHGKCERCKGNYMDTEEWLIHTTKWQGQIRVDSDYNVIPNSVIEIVDKLIEIGDGNPYVRRSLILSIKGMLKDYPGYPYYRGLAP